MRRTVAIGALAAILAAGCSGDDGDAADAPAAETAAEVSEGSEVDDVDRTDDGDESDGSDDDASVTTTVPPSSTTAEPTTTTTTTVAAEPEPEEGTDIDRAVPDDAEAESTGPIGTTETTIPTEEGEISIGGGDVPELGDDFPLPDGFEVQLTSEVEGEIGFSGRIDGDLDELTAFFEAALPDAGYEIIDQQGVPGVLSTMSIEGPLVGDVVISQEPGTVGGWTILVALAEPEA